LNAEAEQSTVANKIIDLMPYYDFSHLSGCRRLLQPWFLEQGIMQRGNNVGLLGFVKFGSHWRASSTSLQACKRSI
jgi:hypothetical protein